MKKVRVGVIGVGGMGSSHCKCLSDLPEAKLTCVCDINPETLADRVDTFGVEGFEDYRDLVKSGLAEAVVVATPHWVHPEICVYAMKHGLHALSEKPIAVTVSQADKMVRAAKKYERVFSVMYQKRTTTDVRMAREIIQRGVIGDVHRTLCINPNFRTQAYYDSGDWRATWKGEGGGVLINQSPHWIDCFMLLGGLPSKVTARTRTRMHKIEVEDEAAAVLEYPNGAWGYYYATTCEPQSDDIIEIIGDKGKLYLSGREGLKVYTYSGSLAKFTKGAKKAWGKLEVKELKLKRPRPITIGHRGIHRNFLRAVGAGARQLSPGEEGLWTVEFIDAIIMSGKTGKPVKVPVSRRGYDALMARLKKTSRLKKGVQSKPLADPDLAAREKVGK